MRALQHEDFFRGGGEVFVADGAIGVEVSRSTGVIELSIFRHASSAVVAVVVIFLAPNAAYSALVAMEAQFRRRVVVHLAGLAEIPRETHAACSARRCKRLVLIAAHRARDILDFRTLYLVVFRLVVTPPTGIVLGAAFRTHPAFSLVVHTAGQGSRARKVVARPRSGIRFGCGLSIGVEYGVDARSLLGFAQIAPHDRENFRLALRRVGIRCARFAGLRRGLWSRRLMRMRAARSRHLAVPAAGARMGVVMMPGAGIRFGVLMAVRAVIVGAA